MTNKTISIVTPCFNEEDNVETLYHKVKDEFTKLDQYTYEHIFIDNASTDKTVQIIKSIAKNDPNIKLIVNSRNFGHLRSPVYGLKQAMGDAAMLVVADLQDPPELIPEFIKKWEEGNEIVIGVKNKSHESPLMYLIRTAYYNLINRLAEIPLAKNYTGFGLYDKKIIDLLKANPDPYPYLRGLIFEFGFNVVRIKYTQPVRKRGITKNNFFTLYDIAMLGICSHSKVPLRIATISGFVFSMVSFLIGICYFIAKLVFWSKFSLGIAPIVIGVFFFTSMQLFFTGILGEYIGFIFTKTNNRDQPMVIEKERVNF
ncbi:MAG: glycosyltransferase family 2 protein [Bacteriovoracaceae bacterium]|nr:glycosyltransferase family 2 protein [Bacteriovoracaceae bacterium]